jgi:hypothetical protein
LQGSGFRVPTTIHRFGSALNAHTHFHVCAIDGLFEPDGEGVRFHTAPAPRPDDIEAVQTAIRQRTLRAFQRRGWLERGDRREMEQWHHGGGFSLDASVVISGGDRRGRERLLRYCARPPFAGERLEWIDAQRVRYRLPRPHPDGRSELILSPPELIERVAALVPPPRRHRLRYFGVLAPNAPLRPAVTALAPEQDADACASGLESDQAPLHTAADEAGPAQAGTRKARYLWAVLLARIHEAFPLRCPHCAGEMRIIAFVTDPASIKAILAHIGEPTRPPPVAPARDPPAWAGDIDAGEVMDPEGEPAGIDPLAQPEPDSIFDQRITW